MARTQAKKLAIKDEGVVLVDDVDSIDFAGSGVSGSAIGKDVTITINAGGGGTGYTKETPTGTVNGSNVSFGVSAQPVYIVADGITYFEGVGYTYAALTITMTSAPWQFIRSFHE